MKHFFKVLNYINISCRFYTMWSKFLCYIIGQFQTFVFPKTSTGILHKTTYYTILHWNYTRDSKRLMSQFTSWRSSLFSHTLSNKIFVFVKLFFGHIYFVYQWFLRTGKACWIRQCITTSRVYLSYQTTNIKGVVLHIFVFAEEFFCQWICHAK